MSDAFQAAGHPIHKPGEPAGEATLGDGAEGIRAKTAADDTVRLPIARPAEISQKKDASDVGALRQQRAVRIEHVLVGLLLLLAFFLGSFTATNSGLWLHLATGRLIASGEYQFGVDPFSWATAEQYWANASWLYDLLIYWIYSSLGGAVLVVCKGLVVVVLTMVLLRIRYPMGSFWPSLVCVALALLAMSPRLLLEPFVCSLVFLGLTIFVLFHAAGHGGAGPAGAAASTGKAPSLWWLPPLFVVWANFDAWFFLGPFTVMLTLLGQVLALLTRRHEPTAAPLQAGRLRTLAVVLPVGVAACLVNPHLHQVFVLPFEAARFVRLTGSWLPGWMLASATTVQEIGRNDPQTLVNLTPLLVSPLGPDYWSFPTRGLNVAGLAYYPLLLLGLISFVALGLKNSFPYPRPFFFLLLLLPSLILVHVVPYLHSLPVFLLGIDVAIEWPILVLALVFVETFLVAICLLGFLSFALMVGNHWPRLLVWIGFAALSATLARTIPLFAVVAAPLTALNLQELALLWFGDPARAVKAESPMRPGRSRLAWSQWGSVAALVTCLALVVLAWQGLLHARHGDPRVSRHVAWDVRADPLIRQGAEQLGHWHVQKKLDRTFNFSPELGHYCAWFAPQAKMCYDLRFELFGPMASDIGRLRQMLRDRPDPESGAASLLRKHGIDDIAITGFDQDPVAKQLAFRFLLEPGKWPHLYGNGRVDVFGWQRPSGPWKNFRDLAVTADAQVFGPRKTELPLPDGPGPFMEEPQAWRYWLLGPAASSGDVETANYHLACYNYLAGWNQRVQFELLQRPGQSLRQIPAWATGSILSQAGAGVAAGPLSLVSVIAIEANEIEVKNRLNTPGPPAQILLAVQAARRAVAANPTDPKAYRVLADAYLYLWQKQEQSLTHQFGKQEARLRQTIRRLQWTAAAKQLLKLDPDNYDIHLALADLYFDLFLLDVVQEHLSAAQPLLERHAGDHDRGLDAKKVRSYAERLRGLNEEVKRRRESFDLRSLGQGMEKKFLIALKEPYKGTNERNQDFQDPRGLGLARQALKVLQESNAQGMPENEYLFRAIWELQLLLDLAEVNQLAQNLDDARLEKGPVGAFYIRAKLMLSAIRGDYAQVDEILAKWESNTSQPLKAQKDILARDLASQLAFDPRVPVQMIVPLCNHVFAQTHGAPRLVQLAEFSFIRGLMALEHGDSAVAAKHLRVVRDLIGDWAFFPDRPILARYLHLLTENHN
jgi:hypothetical protein